MKGTDTMQANLRPAHAGIDVPAALQALAEAAITAQIIAKTLKISPRTIDRWAKGKQQPNTRNYTALRKLVDLEIAEITAGQSIASQRQLSLLQRAKFALRTDQERTAQDRLADELRADLLAYGSLLQPYQSVTTQVDPFDLIGNTDTADDLFGVAA
jgi:hypothetical protein